VGVCSIDAFLGVVEICNPDHSGYGCATTLVAASVVIINGFTSSNLFSANSNMVEEEWRDLQ